MYPFPLFSPASASASVGRYRRWRRWRRLILPLALAPLLAILLALLDGGILPLPRPAPAGLVPAGLAAVIPGIPAIPGGGLGASVPAAEAWGREFRRRQYRLVRNASDVTDQELGNVPDVDPGRCSVELDLDHPNYVRNEGRGIAGDYFCFSYTDRAIVTLTAGRELPDYRPVPYRAYVSTGKPVSEADAWHPNVQTIDIENRQLGRRGLAEYNGYLHSDPAADNHEREIILTRDMASPNSLGGGNFWPQRNGSSVFITIYTGWRDGRLDEPDPRGVPSKITEDGRLADLVDRRSFVIKIYFQQEINITDTWLLIGGVQQNGDGTRQANTNKRDGPTPRISTTGHYHPHPGNAPRPALDRHLILNDYWVTQDEGNNLGNRGNSLAQNTASKPMDGIKYLVQLKDYSTGGYWHPQAETTVRLVFAPGSNLSGASGQYEDRFTERAWGIASGSGHNLRYLSGFNPAGPVRAELHITVNDGQGTIGNVEPFIVIIEGPPASLRLTRVPTLRLNGGIRYVQLNYALTDGLGSPLTGSRDRIRWQGADETTRSIIDRRGGGGTASGGRFIFPIKGDAPAGTYTLTLTAGAVSRDVSFRVYDLPQPKAVPAAPARISASAVAGGGTAPGGRVNFRYTLQDAAGNPLSLPANPVTWAADVSSVVAPDGNVDGARQTDGRFGFDIADDAAPGWYTITIRTAAADADGNPLASARISFQVLGNPASYAIAGPDRVSPGGYAVYTVTATDANGSLPNLAGRYGMVAISVSDAASDDASGVVQLFNLDDGSITLDDAGVGRFRLRADYDAAGRRIAITAASADGAVTETRTVAIGTAP